MIFLFSKNGILHSLTTSVTLKNVKLSTNKIKMGTFFCVLNSYYTEKLVLGN